MAAKRGENRRSAGPRGELDREGFLLLVVDAAEAIARENGLRGLGMRKLAAAVGYAPNSIYHAVGDLDQVVLRVNARTFGRLHDALAAAIAPRTLADQSVSHARPHPEVLRSSLEGALQPVARSLEPSFEAADAAPQDEVQGWSKTYRPDPQGEAEGRNRHVPSMCQATARENALAVAEAYLAFVGEAPLLWSLVPEHAMPPGVALPDWYEEALARTTGLVDTVLAPLLPDPEERGRAVAVLWASLHGLASLSTSGKLAALTPEAPGALARMLVGRFLGPEPLETPARAP